MRFGHFIFQSQKTFMRLPRSVKASQNDTQDLAASSWLFCPSECFPDGVSGCCAAMPFWPFSLPLFNEFLRLFSPLHIYFDREKIATKGFIVCLTSLDIIEYTWKNLPKSDGFFYLFWWYIEIRQIGPNLFEIILYHVFCVTYSKRKFHFVKRKWLRNQNYILWQL